MITTPGRQAGYVTTESQGNTMVGNSSLEAADLRHESKTAQAAPAREIPPASKSFEQKIIALCHRIESVIDAPEGRIVCVAGMQTTTQGFTYTYELARQASQQLGKRVLVISTFGSGFSDQVIRSGVVRGWAKALESGEVPVQSIVELRTPAISVSQLNGNTEDVARIAASPALKEVFEKLRKAYDLVLIDTPSMSESMDAELLAPAADGIVLIVDAGAARWQVMRRKVEELMSRQVNVAGVVLNKRRHYIPNFIYNKL